jgi:UDP-glucose 4-epimerase
MQGTVVVTGGNGFIGSHVIEQLVSMDYKVISIDPREDGNLFMEVASVTYVNRGVKDMSWDANAIDHIIHLGAWSNVRESMTRPLKLYMDNTLSTAYILDGIFRAGDRTKVKSIVFASSSAVESPESHYGVSKLASELMLDIFRDQMVGRMSISNLRFGNVYGPRQNPANGTVIAKFVDCVFTGAIPEIYGKGNQTRDYIYVKDVVDAIITCMIANDYNETIYGIMEPALGLNDTLTVCSGTSWSVDEIYDAVKSAADSLGFDLEDPKYLPARKGDKDKVMMVQSHVLGEAGWFADMPLRDGIRAQIEWYNTMEGSWDSDHLIDGSRV